MGLPPELSPCPNFVHIIGRDSCPTTSDSYRRPSCASDPIRPGGCPACDQPPLLRGALLRPTIPLTLLESPLGVSPLLVSHLQGGWGGYPTRTSWSLAVSAASRPGFGATAPRRTARHRRKDAPPANAGSRSASREPAVAPHRGAGAARGDADEPSGRDESHDSDHGDDPDGARDDGPPPEGPAGAARRLTGGPWGRFAEKWVPDSLRDARIDPGRRGALLLTVIAALAAVVAAVGVWRDRPEPRPVQSVALAPATSTVAQSRVATSAPVSGVGGDATSAGPAEVGVGAPPAGTDRSPPDSAAVTEIFVSVTGLVRRPGLVRLRPGARVADAIAAAGGLDSTGDLTGLNLAARLADGDSVVVGSAASDQVQGSVGGAPATTGSTSSAAPATTGGVLVDLNTADQAALEALPGVGPVMASNILGWRQTNGAFTSVEQLQEVTGIGPARFAQLAPLVTV